MARFFAREAEPLDSIRLPPRANAKPCCQCPFARMPKRCASFLHLRFARGRTPAWTKGRHRSAYRVLYINHWGEGLLPKMPEGSCLLVCQGPVLAANALPTGTARQWGHPSIMPSPYRMCRRQKSATIQNNVKEILFFFSPSRIGIIFHELQQMKSTHLKQRYF